jgi:hypothetical protein
MNCHPAFSMLTGLIGLLVLHSCQPQPQAGKPDEGDSLTVEVPLDVQSYPEVAVTAQELLGSWLLISMETGDMEIPMEGKDTLEFLPEGVLILSGEVSRSSGRFYQREDLLESEIWPKPQRIRELNRSTLTLIDTVDGLPILYHYRHL